jgi:hypothetical protein
MIGRGMSLVPRKLHVTQTSAELEAEQDPTKKVYAIWMEEK